MEAVPCSLVSFSSGSSESNSRTHTGKSTKGVHSSRSRSAEPAPPTRKLLTKRGKDRQEHRRNHDNRSQSGSSRRTPSSRYRYTPTYSTQNSVTVVKSRGYSINRTPSSVAVNINTATFFDEAEVESSLRGPGRYGAGLQNPERPTSATGKALSALTEQMEKMNVVQVELQTEVAERRIQLEKDREAHREEIKKLQKRFQEEKETMQLEHDKEKSDCINKHKEALTFIHESHKEEIHTLRDSHEKTEAQLKAEIMLSKELHASTVAELHKENDGNIAALKQRVKLEHESEMELLEEVLRKDSIEQVRQTKEDLDKKHAHELEKVKGQHDEDMEKLLEQFSRIHEVEEELTKSKKQVKKLEKQASRLKTEMKSAQSTHLDTEAQLMMAKTELERFKADFHRKIREAQVRTKDRLDELMLENCQLRKKYLAKSEELSQYRADVESSRAKTLRSYKEQMQLLIKARTRANLSVAAGISEEGSTVDAATVNVDADGQSPPRPSSAPITRLESSRAWRTIQSAESSRKKLMVIKTAVRPKSCLANLDH